MKLKEVQEKMRKDEQDGTVLLGGIRDEGGRFMAVIEIQDWEKGEITNQEFVEKGPFDSHDKANEAVREGIDAIEAQYGGSMEFEAVTCVDKDKLH